MSLVLEGKLSECKSCTISVPPPQIVILLLRDPCFYQVHLHHWQVRGCAVYKKNILWLSPEVLVAWEGTLSKIKKKGNITSSINFKLFGLRFPTPPWQGSNSPPWEGFLCQIPNSLGMDNSQMPVGYLRGRRSSNWLVHKPVKIWLYIETSMIDLSQPLREQIFVQYTAQSTVLLLPNTNNFQSIN